MLLDLSDLSNLLIVRFVNLKVLGSSVKGVRPSFLAELQSNLSYMLGAADMISSRTPDRYLHFHSS